MNRIMEIRTRIEDIKYTFLEGERIWLPALVPLHFLVALKKVLVRLPEDDYNKVTDFIWFVVEHPGFTAQNIPIDRPFIPAGGEKIECYVIVIFHGALSYSRPALMGLIAHEIAHSFVNGSNYTSDELAADEKAISWGFKKELEALKLEQACKSKVK